MKTLRPKTLVGGLVFPEGPRWRSGKLWLSDMLAHQVIAVDRNGSKAVVAEVGQRPSGLGFLPDGRLLIVSMGDRRLLRLDPDGLRTVADLTPMVTGNLNDMVVDGQGRAYVGNVGVRRGEDWEPANLVLVSGDGRARVVAEDLQFPNGCAITPDGKTLIVAETYRHVLTAFTIQLDGSLTQRRTFADLGEAVPDGICLDAEGAVWLGSFLTGAFLRVMPGGAVTHTISVPGRWAVACTLGGRDRRTLFLVTATTTFDQLRAGKSAGQVETVRVDVPGAGWP